LINIASGGGRLYQRDMCGPSVIFPINQRASHLEMYLSTADKKHHTSGQKAAIRAMFQVIYYPTI